MVLNATAAVVLLLCLLIAIPIILSLGVVVGVEIKQLVADWATNTNNRFIRKISF